MRFWEQKNWITNMKVEAQKSSNPYLRGGLAECAERAEAFEFASSRVSILHASAPEGGRRIETRHAYSAGPQHFETSAGLPACMCVYVYVCGVCMCMYMCMCTCICLYMCMYIMCMVDISVYGHVYVYVHSYVNGACICVFICICVCVCVMCMCVMCV